MNIKIAALAALLLAPVQAMAEEFRVDCAPDQRIVCRDNETTCRAPFRESVTFHFTFDLTKKTGSLVFCSDDGCMEPSPLTVVRDHCKLLGDYGAGCLSGPIYVWEQNSEETWTISNSRFVMTHGGVTTNFSQSIKEFGRCAVQ
jgi:hypothetical protein